MVSRKSFASSFLRSKILFSKNFPYIVQLCTICRKQADRMEMGKNFKIRTENYKAKSLLSRCVIIRSCTIVVTNPIAFIFGTIISSREYLPVFSRNFSFTFLRKNFKIEHPKLLLLLLSSLLLLLWLLLYVSSYNLNLGENSGETSPL